MASRYASARPKREGEEFARTHQHEGDGLGEGDGKRVRFDVRNPSTLAPDAREENAILEADVISGGNATKRGAVNLDGYDSDSENETFEAKAAGRKQGAVDLLEQLDSYDPRGGAEAGKSGSPAGHDDDDDMFAADGDNAQDAKELDKGSGRREKKVHFMDASRIDGEEDGSKSGGHVRLDEQESSDDENAELAKEEQGLDEEVGAGGLKRNAPKIEAFNLREEMEQGRFDEAGNYVRQAADPDANHDRWLDGLSKKDMKKAAEAHEKREAAARRQRLQEDDVLVADLLEALILQLEKTETPLEALARLGKKKTRGKKTPKWKLKKLKNDAEDMEVDAEGPEDPAQARIKASIDAITDAADKLLSRDYEDVYDMEREMLAHEYKRQTGDDWVESKAAGDADGGLWEFRWTDGRDGGATQGPFDAATMKAWQEAGYLGQGVEFRSVAPGGGDWTPTAAFA